MMYLQLAEWGMRKMDELKKLLENAGIKEEWSLGSREHRDQDFRPAINPKTKKPYTQDEWNAGKEPDVEPGKHNPPGGGRDQFHSIEEDGGRRVRIEDIFQDIKDHVGKGKPGQSITVKIKDAGQTLPGSVFQYEISVDSNPGERFKTPVGQEQSRIDDYYGPADPTGTLKRDIDGNIGPTR